MTLHSHLHPLINDQIEKLLAVFVMLIEARKKTRNLQSNSEQLSLTVRELYKVGLEENDLQWLLAKGVLGLDLKQKVSVYRTRKPRVASSPTFDARSRVFLRDTEQLVAEQGVAHNMSNSKLEKLRNKGNEIPIWNKGDRELHWRGKLVKSFSTPAINQELLLDEFEKRGWVRRIENPLSDAINELSKEQLAQAVRRLNGCQREPRIRFARDGTGHGVRWG
jgi:hypothetical protein